MPALPTLFRNRLGCFAALVLVTALTERLSAANGDLDLAFNPDLTAGAPYAYWGDYNDSVYFTGHGKIIKMAVAGGTIDTSYNPPIRLANGATSGFIHTFEFANDGTATVAGHLFSPDGNNEYNLVRLLRSGLLDQAFTPVPAPAAQQGVAVKLFHVEALADGRHILGVSTYNFNTGVGQDRFNLIGLNGVVDPQFELRGKDVSIHRLPDGGLMAVGLPLTGNGPDTLLRRYRPDLSVDLTFVPPPFKIEENAPYEFVGVVEGAQFVSFSTGEGGITLDGAPVKQLYSLRPNGTLDPDFVPYCLSDSPAPAGFECPWFEFLHSDASTLLVLADWLGTDDPSQRALRLQKVSRTTGEVSASFDPIIRLFGYSGPVSATLDPGGKVLVKTNRPEGIAVNGSLLPDGQATFRLNTDGGLDTTFPLVLDPVVLRRNQAGDSIAASYSVFPLGDGSTILHPSNELPFTEVNGQPRAGIALLRADGTLDLDFNPNIMFASGGYQSLELNQLASGDLFITGSFTAIDGQPRPAGVARLLMESSSRGQTFLEWAAMHTVPTTPSATRDTDSDGVPDVMEYASNLDPNTPDAGIQLQPGATRGLPLTRLVGEGMDRQLQITVLHRKNVGAGGVTSVAEFSSDLFGWQKKTIPDRVEPIDGNWEHHVFLDTFKPPESPPIRFSVFALAFAF